MNHGATILGIRLLALTVFVLFFPSAYAQTVTDSQAANADDVVKWEADVAGLPLIATNGQDIPRFGTFWLPPSPGSSGWLAPYPAIPNWVTGDSVGNLNVYALPDGGLLVDTPDGTNIWARINSISNVIQRAESVATSARNASTASTMTAMDTPAPPSPGGSDTNTDNGTNTLNPLDVTNAPIDYGSNLYVARWVLTNGVIAGVASNTLADVEYELLTNGNLAMATNWGHSGVFVLGSEATNWTPLNVISPNSTNNLFFRLLSWQSSDGIIPDWWELKFFGTIGINPYSDPAGDGWTVLQSYINGWIPTNFYTPPNMQGVYATADGSGNNVLNWIPPGVTPDSFTIQENTGSGWQTIATVAGDVTSFVVSNPPVNATFEISANYPNGSSAYTSAGSQSFANGDLSLPAAVAAGANGRLFLLTAKPQTLVTGLVVMASPDEGDDFPKDGIYAVAPQYPYTTFNAINNPVAGELPASQLQGSPLRLSAGLTPIYGWYDISFETLGTNGTTSSAAQQTLSADATPFLDGRQHLLDNLNFALRAAPASQPFDFYFPANLYASAGTFYGIFPNYTTAGFSWAYGNNDDVLYRSDILDPFLPFENDSVLRAFCFNTNQFDAYGNPLDVGYDGYFESLPTMNTWDYYFDALSYVQSGDTNVPARQIDSATAQYIFYGPANDESDVPDLGLTWDESIPGWRVSSDPRNVYGLRILSILCVKSSPTPEPLTYYVAAPGGVIPEMGTTNNPGSGWLYFETENPGYQKTGFHFVPEAYANTELTGPGYAEWTGVPNTNDLVASVGSQSSFYLWTQLTVTNANPGTVSYLEDYFDAAYKIDTNGVVTTNQTGVLSEYGSFFPTEPGPVALVTKPDLATGQTCTGVVQVVSLNVDANNDGTIDPTFYGADYTTPDHPYTFWVNNNFDRWHYDPNDNTIYMDDVENGGCPYLPNSSTPDYNYRDVNGNRVIPCTRDLEDFFRLWVSGVNSNLLAALPPGGTITLSWNNISSGSPTIDLFVAADSDGGIGYLTNETTATTQIDPVQSPYVGRLIPGSNLQLNASQFANNWAGNHFIVCGVSNGVGALNLTIADASGNVMAQSTVYLKLVDIKQMYERWTVGDLPNYAPAATPVLAGEGLSQPFYYNTQAPAGTPYILFVHGWNLEQWEKDRFAESAFKRLYWQGYHGRFGEFRWPTDYNFEGLEQIIYTNADEADNFDRSEYSAWQSGQGLLNLLTSLNAKYPGNVYLLAHSLGNVVAGEALRLAGTNQVVNTYVASQAAVTAHTYDNSISDYSFSVLGYSLGPKTPNIYGNWFAANAGGGAGIVVNFYNTNDYALSRYHWQLDELVKPDKNVLEGTDRWTYDYSGSASDPSPWNNFYKTDTNSTTYAFNIVTSLNNRYEVMSYAAQAYTTALGATPGVLNLNRNIDLTRISPTRIWPSDPAGKNYTEHFWHSAEFEGDYPQQQGYWSELLSSEAFGLK